jgi:membrane fusion protein, macrolide-specific efflux system
MSTFPFAVGPAEELPQVAQSPRRRWPWLIALIVVAGAAAAGWHYWPRPSPLAGVALTTAKTADVEDAVTALGKLQPRDYVDVGAQVSGQLKRLAVAVGERVERGQLLAEIDPQLQLAKLEMDRALLAQLEADRAVQQVQVELSTLQFERQQQMKASGATRDDVFQQKRSDVAIAAAKLASIEAQIRQARSTIKADEAQLGYTRIFAPISGTVVSVEARVGQTLIAVQQVPQLLRIADLATLTVWAQVSEADVTRLHVGMPVYFTTLGHRGRKWHGTLRQLLPAPYKPPANANAPANTSSNQVVLYTALFDVDNAAGELRPEMSAQAFFVNARARDAVVVPVTALREEDGKTRLRVAAADGTLALREVKVGVKNRFDAEISSGLSAGERVVEKDDP